MSLSLHQDPEFFREAVLYTAGRTGLSAALVEKDYYCTILLDYLYQDENTSLVFKGGTSLSKVHADFHRLSEDLDFAISMPFASPRSARRQRIEPVKKQIERVEGEIPAFALAESLAGHNESTQYIACVRYRSAVEVRVEPARIKIEVGLREELAREPVRLPARTLLANPFTRRPAVPEVLLNTLDLQEVYAEKLRAALTRREPAIRDFYDIYYAVTRLDLDLHDEQYIELVMKKLDQPGNEPVDTSLGRRELLEKQLDSQLKPVLRPQDFDSFRLDKVFELVAEVVTRIRKKREQDE